MNTMPLALTGEYEPPREDGEYAFVVIKLNGQELLRIISDDPVADTHHRTTDAVQDAIREVLSEFFRGYPKVHVTTYR